MLNQIILMGRLTKDPELRYTQSQKPVASFTLAVDRDYAPAGEQKETDFIDVIAWNATANFVHDHFMKGQLAAVRGRLQMRKWEDRDGNKRTSAEVVADAVYFCEAKKKDDAPVVLGRFDFNKLQELSDSDGELPF